MKDLEAFIKGLSEATSQRELETYFLREIQSIGYCAYDAFSVRSDSLNQPRQKGNFVVTSYPLGLIREYVEKGFVNQCPALAQAGKSNIPFDYLDFLRNQRRSPAVLWQMRLLSANRIKHAWLVPLNAVGIYAGVTVYYGPGGSAEAQQAGFLKTRDQVHLMAGYFFQALVSFDPSGAMNELLKTGEDTSLSDRELECLRWCALGKTNGDIGFILGISENTVRFHMKNIFRKLNVSSRVQAVSRAVAISSLAV